MAKKAHNMVEKQGNIKMCLILQRQKTINFLERGLAQNTLFPTGCMYAKEAADIEINFQNFIYDSLKAHS